MGNDKIRESNDVKLLKVNIDRGLKFDSYLSKNCAKANRNVTIVEC